MKAKLVRIGNSRGVRLPKTLIEQAALEDDVNLELHDGTIIVSRAGHPRSGWGEAAARQRAAGEDELHEMDPTRFDMTEWTW